MALEEARHKRAQEARDAESERLRAERVRLQASLDAAARAQTKREEELARRERELERREREKVFAVESQVASLREEQRKRDLWFRLRRGVSLLAQKRRMKV